MHAQLCPPPSTTTGAHRLPVSLPVEDHRHPPTVDGIPPDVRATIDRAAQACAEGRNSDAIRLTRDVDDADQVSAVLLTYRAVALARVGMFRSAMTAFATALRTRGATTAARHFVLRTRAEVFAADGNRARACRDLRRIVTEDPAATGAAERLLELRAD